jgi:hypothetical protein
MPMAANGTNHSSEAIQTIRLRAIIFREEDVWVAQCIEYDIGTQAKTLSELQKRLESAICLELYESIKRAGAPFKGVPRAPLHIEEMWNNRAGAFNPVEESGVVPTHHTQTPKIGLELGLCA